MDFLSIVYKDWVLLIKLEASRGVLHASTINNVALERKATHCNGGGEGQRRLERNVKATEALEWKKRNAEKGQIMVNLRARKKAKQSTRDF
ncbi:hypothetical protein Tco_1068032 [Tanacetum coccineum]|uniref:Uncharacterized protein n=1 Tax=Tanacetum coccineum TaxID=301880 RepID=A0ABQ5HEL9_9ASTR